MKASAVLKKVKEAHPEAFAGLPKPKLKLVERAILYASELTASEEVLSESEHRMLMKTLTGTEVLSSGQRLKAYRLREDLTQAALAQRCGIPQANISAMESGVRSIGIIAAKKLARALNCDFRQLI